MNELLNVNAILEQNEGRNSYSVWKDVQKFLQEQGVQCVPATEGEREYGMCSVLPFEFTLYGRNYVCSMESGSSFHHPNTSAVVVYNRTLDRVQKRAYCRY